MLRTLPLGLLLVFSAFARAEEAFPYERSRASVAFTAARHQVDDNTVSWSTCAATIIDVQQRQLVVPLQCFRPGEPIVCRAAVAVAVDAQLVSADFARWQREGASCKVERAIPELNLALLRADTPLPKESRSAELQPVAPSVGSRVWAIGFPEQVPAFLSAAAVGALLSKIKIDGVPDAFHAQILVASGARAGSEGSPLFDAAGRVVGFVIAHAKFMDGGMAVPSANLAKALKTR